MNLYNYFLSNTGNPIHKNLHYFPIYERYFSKYINEPITFLEIGAGGGGSSQMWKRYFGPLARIVTIDIRPECKKFEDDQVAVRIGDQSDEIFLNSLIEEFGAPDIVLDDGSHQMHHVVATFKYLYSKTFKSGIYMVEDMHTSYWDEWGGGLGREGSFIELCKRLVDELNADHIQGALVPPSVGVTLPSPFPPTAFTRSTRSISFYDSVVVFEKGIVGAMAKRSVASGDLSMPIG